MLWVVLMWLLLKKFTPKTVLFVRVVAVLDLFEQINLLNCFGLLRTQLFYFHQFNSPKLRCSSSSRSEFVSGFSSIPFSVQILYLDGGRCHPPFGSTWVWRGLKTTAWDAITTPFFYPTRPHLLPESKKRDIICMLKISSIKYREKTQRKYVGEMKCRCFYFELWSYFCTLSFLRVCSWLHAVEKCKFWACNIWGRLLLGHGEVL